jgi:hypothetical protein
LISLGQGDAQGPVLEKGERVGDSPKVMVCFVGKGREKKLESGCFCGDLRRQ